MAVISGWSCQGLKNSVVGLSFPALPSCTWFCTPLVDKLNLRSLQRSAPSKTMCSLTMDSTAKEYWFKATVFTGLVLRSDSSSCWREEKQRAEVLMLVQSAKYPTTVSWRISSAAREVAKWRVRDEGVRMGLKPSRSLKLWSTGWRSSQRRTSPFWQAARRVVSRRKKARMFMAILGLGNNKSQKILGDAFFVLLGLFFGGLEYLVVLGAVFVEFEDGRHVAAAVAVVGGRPHRHQFLRKHLLVPLHHQLVRPADQRNVVGPVELLHTALPEQVPCPSRRHRPPFDLVRIRPHQVAHRPVVRNLLLPVDRLDVLDVRRAGRKSPVHAKYLVVDEGGEGQVVENLSAVLPDIEGAILAEALVVEAIDLGDLSGLVVASEEGDSGVVPDFEGEEEDEGFDAVEASVYEVAHEEVGDPGGVSSDFEEFEEVVELAVDVSADSDGGVDPGEVGFPGQDVLRLVAQQLHAGLFHELVVLDFAEDVLHCLQIRLHHINQ